MSTIDPEDITPPMGTPAAEAVAFRVESLAFAYGPYPAPPMLSVTDGGSRLSCAIPDAAVDGPATGHGITVRGRPASWCDVLRHLAGARPGTFPRVTLTFAGPGRSIAIQADFRRGPGPWRTPPTARPCS